MSYMKKNDDKLFFAFLFFSFSGFGEQKKYVSHEKDNTMRDIVSSDTYTHSYVFLVHST